jgi:hypothetical protein
MREIPNLQENLTAKQYKEAIDNERAGCLMLLDTELEKEIGLGTKYPFGP